MTIFIAFLANIAMLVHAVVPHHPPSPRLRRLQHQHQLLHLRPRTIGAAKTGAYYAVAPFIGAFISICFLGESITPMLLIAGIVMAAGCWFAAR